MPVKAVDMRAYEAVTVAARQGSLTH